MYRLLLRLKNLYLNPHETLINVSVAFECFKYDKYRNTEDKKPWKLGLIFMDISILTDSLVLEATTNKLKLINHTISQRYHDI